MGSIENVKSSASIALRFNAALKVFEVALAIVITIVMARLLDPLDFGIIAMCSIFTGIGAVFIEFGTGDAIIRHDETKTNQSFLSSIFWFNFLIGICVSLVLISFSSFISNFFGQKIIEIIIVVSTINVMLSAVCVVPRSILRKRLDFKSIFYQKLMVLPISGIIAIYLASEGFGVWSLVVQSIAVSFGAALILMIYARWYPRIEMKKEHIREIWDFSIYLSYSKFVSYFTKKGDIFLIGKFIGGTDVGIYSKGYQLTVQLLKTINGTIINVLYPSISKIKDDYTELRTTYLKVSYVIFNVFGVLVVLGVLLAEPAVLVILGEKWSDLISLIPIFLFLALFLGLGSVGSHYLKALGYSKAIFRITIQTSLITVASFALGLQWGIYGVAVGYLGSTILLFLMITGRTLDKLGVSVTEYSLTIISPAGVIVLSYILSRTVFNVFPFDSNIVLLIVGVVINLAIQFIYHVAFQTVLYASARMVLRI